MYQIAIQDGNGIRCERCQPCNDCNNIYSVAKVFLNTAIGVLIDEKKLKLDDTILPFLQPYIDFSYADVWNNVTVQHALSHRMGVDEGVIDIDRDDIRTYGTDNHLKYILDYPPKFRLGSYRKYTDCGHYLLSLVIEQITGMPADDFIRESILCRLDFQHTAWTRCPLNHTVGATGAYMRAADMVKLGWMYVNNGKYDDKHILSEGWTRQMEKEKFDFYPVKGSSFFRKGGMNGQMLLYSREKNISIAWMGFEDDKKIQQFADFIVGQI
ncbi:MAG: beta-lactamase family protein [Clostridia bacterium]|nr:beta-lactamase family protein [Clostridia bacterium]